MKGNFILAEADKKELYLRTAQNDDIDLLFQWANNPDVRRNSFHSEPIAYETHKKWFAEHFDDINEIQYILMEGTEPVGQIRFSIEGNTAGIGYSIDTIKRNKGYGEKIVSLAIDRMRSEYPEIKRFTAKVKTDNLASTRCFGKNGFKETFKQFELQI